MRCRLLAAWITPCIAACLGSAAWAAPISIGDSGVACRLADGKSIDVDTTIARLAAMKVDTYLYDIPHGTDAWDKLPAFCEAAAGQGIDVWVYLFPWSLARRGGRDDENEPFGLDYVRWCAEVGRLMHDHPNLKGIVMDDFAANINESDRFTPTYVQQMIDAGHAAHERFAFQPILYFDGPWEQTLGQYASFFSGGAIVCYPRSTREVQHAVKYLNDEPRGASLIVELPRKRTLKAGERTTAVARIDGNTARQARSLAFYVDDRGGSNGKRGDHAVVLRVDRKEVWRRDLNGDPFDRDVVVDLPDLRDGSTIEASVVCERPAQEEVVRSDLEDVRLLDRDGRLVANQPRWTDELDDGISFQIAQPTEPGQGGRWKIPMTIMVAGAPFEHEKIFNEPGDAKHVAPKVRQAVDWARSGKARGVMTWWTPKDKEGTELRDTIAAEFSRAK